MNDGSAKLLPGLRKARQSGALGGPVAIGRQQVAPRQPLPAEWLELSYAVETLRVNKKTSVLQFVGADSKVGTTTVASGFARVAGQAVAESMSSLGMGATLPVLFIDCTPGVAATRRRRGREVQSLSLVEAFRQDSLSLDIVTPSDAAAGVFRAWLGATDAMTRCGPAELARLFDVLRERFSLVVLDCPALPRGVGPLSLAPHCDGTVVVLRAASTQISAVRAACDRIDRVGGQVIGTVLNRVPRRSPWLFGRSRA